MPSHQPLVRTGCLTHLSSQAYDHKVLQGRQDSRYGAYGIQTPVDRTVYISRPARCAARATVDQSNHSKPRVRIWDYDITAVKIKIQISNTWP